MGRLSAIKLLEKAHETLQERKGGKSHKATIAQNLARLYIDIENRGGDKDQRWHELETAHAWAKKAIEHAPGNFATHDTLGRVYKEMLW